MPRIASLVGILAAAAALGCGSRQDDAETFTVTLDRAEGSRPSAGIAGKGVFVFDGQRVTFTLQVDEGRFSQAHIHTGVRGSEGPLRVILGGSSGAPGRQLYAQGSFTEADLMGTSLSALLEDMRSGRAYTDLFQNEFGTLARGQVQRTE